MSRISTCTSFLCDKADLISISLVFEMPVINFHAFSFSFGWKNRQLKNNYPSLTIHFNSFTILFIYAPPGLTGCTGIFWALKQVSWSRHCNWSGKCLLLLSFVFLVVPTAIGLAFTIRWCRSICERPDQTFNLSAHVQLKYLLTTGVLSKR